MEGFSYKHRSDILRRFQNQVFDVVIIGGGITGAGIALDAVTRGLKTALVEKNDFASGTSSKSTKLIHGGLRYLKQFHFKMVADVGRERRIVHKIAPHLVMPEKMLLPVMKKSSMGMLAISAGLKLYDILAGVRGDDRRKMLGRSSTLAEEPLLPEEEIKGSGLYAEYRTDDARLTIELIKTAHRYGAICCNYLQVKDFHYRDSLIDGVHCVDQFNQNEIFLRGRHIINASGPWVDELRAIDHSLTGKKLFITKGVHLVISREELPVKHSIYFEIEDGRMIFLIPRDRITYIGTTDTPFKGDKDHPDVSKEDAEYLLGAVNSIFPDINLKFSDIESSWAGLRPLIYEEGKTASEISRKDEVFQAPSGLMSIAGGKLTGYRKMARKVVDRIVRDLKRREHLSFGKCKTSRIQLSGNKFRNYQAVSAYIVKITKRLRECNVPEIYAAYLVHNYGIQANYIIDQMNHIASRDPEWRLLKSELNYCLHWEMVCKPLDFLERRTGRLYFWIGTVRKYYMDILNTFRERLDWDQEVYDEEKATLEKIIRSSNTFT